MDNRNGFMSYYYTKSIKQIRTCIVASIIVYWLFGFVDNSNAGRFRDTFLAIRFLYYTPVAAAILIYSFTKGFRKHFQAALVLLSVAAGIGMIVINSIAISFDMYSYKYGIMLTLIFMFTLTRLRFIYASVASWMIIAFYNIMAMMAGNIPHAEYIDTNIMLVAFCLVGMLSCYFVENYEWKNYNLMEMLKIERDKVIRSNDFTFQRLFEGSTDTIFIIENARIIDCNRAATEQLGYENKGDLIGKAPWELSDTLQPDGSSSKEKLQSYLEQCMNNFKVRYEWWNVKSDGTKFPVDVILTSIFISGRNVIHAMCRDVSERKELENRLTFLSYRDQLTNLYNRRFFEEELKRLDVERNLPLTLVIGDVNGLKLVNDSFGHAVGDSLLKAVAESIKEGCRSDDIIARLGGDEYAIILAQTGPEEAETIINRIKSITVGKAVESVNLSISFGWETKWNMQQSIDDIFKKAEDFMYKKKLFEGPSMRSKTIDTIIKTLHEKNKREEKHSKRVSELCVLFGGILGLNGNEIHELRTVGLLHDIGKITVDDNILNKQGVLSVEERMEIQKHSETGYRILNTVREMSEIAQYVLYHHERWDGTGYPKGLKGEEIPIQARIIAIADAYDAMTSSRSYREALSGEYAVNEIARCAGTQFDPELVKALLENLKLVVDEKNI